MKVQNIFRSHVVIIGFAAAFLLVGSARSQEIDNTVWADSSTVEPFPQPAPVVAANELSPVTANSLQTDAATLIARASVNEKALSEGAGKEAWLIGMSMMLMAPLGVLVVGKVRRGKSSVNSREYHSKKSTALS